MKIGIAGAGIAGLTAAYRLSQAGHEVTLFEKENTLGGLASSIDFAGTKIDRIYRHIFKSDLHIVNLIDELGLSEKMLWLESKMGWFRDGKLYPFTTPLDILSFKPLPFIDRVKVGLMAVYLTKVNNWKKYEEITAKTWVEKYVGKKVYEVIWGALLEQKFGERAKEGAMTWLYGRIHSRIAGREKGGAKEVLGYMDGSYQLLIDKMETEIVKNKGTIKRGVAVNKVIVENSKATGFSTHEGEFKFDKVIVTAAPAILRKLVEFPKAYDARFDKLNYYGAVVMLVRMKKQLTPYYWINMGVKDSPFVAMIEHTNFIDKKYYGGDRVLYLGKYLSTEDALYKMPNDELKKIFFDYLKKVAPAFDEKEVLEMHIYREPFSQPIVPLHFSKIKLDYQTPIENLYSANMSQIYPEDRGMSYSVMLGNEVAKKINTSF